MIRTLFGGTINLLISPQFLNNSLSLCGFASNGIFLINNILLLLIVSFGGLEKLFKLIPFSKRNSLVSWIISCSTVVYN